MRNFYALLLFDHKTCVILLVYICNRFFGNLLGLARRLTLNFVSQENYWLAFYYHLLRFRWSSLLCENFICEQ
jgi:hypothetical protein